ncbi:MAG TPA: site-specific DNA-methyltransferase [Leptolyngbya sp.]|jgi:DNA modification methylase|nr:site-specific DNA-methyltransferase [Leptolyngbya sp.]
MNASLAFNDSKNSAHSVLWIGHCIDILQQLESASIDCVVTSPPYYSGLRDYQGAPQVWGGASDCDHCDHRWSDWQEFKSIREATQHGKTRTTERFYGSRSRKFNGNHQKRFAGADCERCGAWQGQLGQEPTLKEYVQHLVDVFTQVWRVLKPSGVVWLNLGDCYASAKQQDGLFKPKDLMLAPHRAVIALQESGWWVRNDHVWSKLNAMPESIRDRCTRGHEYIFQLTKSKNYYFDIDAIKEPASFNRWGGDQFKPSQKQSPRGLHRDRSCFGDGTRHKRTVWSMSTVPYPKAHMATFPPEIPRVCILASCPEGGTVLDIFAGSGTTLEVAATLGRNAIGVELNPEYAKLVRQRCLTIEVMNDRELELCN